MKALHQSKKYKLWRRQLSKNGVLVSKEKNLALVPKGKTDEILFAFLEIKAKSKQGDPLPSSVLIRGPAVVIIPILIERETKKKYVILVNQLRCATGGLMWELPAGMMDDIHDPKKVALKEFEEEVGLPLGKTRLKRINRKLLFSSPGLLDEGITYFYFEKILPRKQIVAMNHQKRGSVEENENITLRCMPFKKAFSLVHSIPALYGLSWYALNRIETPHELH
jgi:8-oxo-dGTP pyrophosphatase MutT (NUDIX family)